MVVIPLSELRKKLDRHCYIPQHCEDNDELIQLLDLRGPTRAGVLQHDSILRWVDEADAWKARFPSRSLSRADQYPLHLALKIHCPHALAESRTMTVQADCENYIQDKLHHLRQLLASVIYGFVLRLTEFRFDGDHPQLPGHLAFIFPGEHDQDKCMSDNTIIKALRVMGDNTWKEICGHGFRAMACSALS